MSSKTEFLTNCVNAYRSIALHPTLLSAKLLKNSNHSDFIKIVSQWSQKNIEEGETTKFQKFHLVHLLTDTVIESKPVDISLESLSKYSKSDNYQCIVKEIKEENKKKTYLEIWNDKGLYKNFDTNAFDLHGDIYCDVEFSSLEWSPSDDKIIYIAEKKEKKSEPFYQQKCKKEDNVKQNKYEEEILLGEEYLYKPDWGEQLFGKHQSVVGVCDISSETLKILDGIPSNFSAGQVLWSKEGDSLFGVVFKNEPRRLGLIYCTNRESYIFHLNFKGEFRILSDKNKSVRSPRLSLDGKSLFWLQRPVGGAHGGCLELVRLDIATSKIESMIGIYKTGDKKFSGLYLHHLPERCFSKNGLKLFFSSLNRTRIVSYYLDIETKEIHELETGEGSSTILDVFEDNILISSGSFNKPSCLKMSSLTNLKWKFITKSEDIGSNLTIKEFDFDSSGGEDTFTYYNALYYGPSSPDDLKKKVPLIVYPHGGPHSAIFNDFFIEFNFFVRLGYGILAVNYRGSTGVGQDGVDFLRGKLGDTDVKDVQEAVLTVLKEISYLDSTNVFLYGKSYGGFLVAHLSGKYPDFYRAVVNVNGVSDVYSMFNMSDIPDWSTAESNLEFDETKPFALAEFRKMIEASPIQLVENIKAPTFFMVGKKDLRVPFYQGVRMFNALKARQIKVKLNLYDSNHTLGNVPVHIDSVINSALWFHENKCVVNTKRGTKVKVSPYELKEKKKNCKRLC